MPSVVERSASITINYGVPRPLPPVQPPPREEVDPITEALGRLVTTLDAIGLEACA
jgi:hypothetical protein